MRVETYGIGGYDPNHPEHNLVDSYESPDIYVESEPEPQSTVNIVEHKHTTETVHILPRGHKLALWGVGGLAFLDLVLNVWK